MSEPFRREVTLHSMDPSAVAATQHTILMLSQAAPLAHGLALTVDGERAFLEAPNARALDFGIFAVKNQGYVKSVSDA